MEKLFKISVFTKVEDKFEFSHYKVYTITYLASSKSHLLRIVVNGLISNQTINILHPKEHGGHKHKILKAVSEFYNGELKMKGVRKAITMSRIEQLYSKVVIKNIHEYLLPINKEVSRDVLTKYNLI